MSRTDLIRLGAAFLLSAALHGAARAQPADAVRAVERGEFDIAFEMAREAAEAGDADAQAFLGELYAGGVGTPENFTEAARWRLAAAEQGHADAQNAIGRHYAEGYGVERDFAEAARWLALAASTGEAAYIHDLALFHESAPPPWGDINRAVAGYERAAAIGHAPSQANLGFLLYDGSRVDQDLGRAFDLLRAAAEAGEPFAQNNLGLIYTRGDGVEQDYEAAVDLFRRAAEAGVSQAWINLGVMYENGFGVTLDEEEARRLYRLGGRMSGAAGLQARLNEIGLPLDARFAAPATDAAALAALETQARAGDPVGAYLLAWVYSTGHGAAPDFPRAARLYRAAADRGYGSAMLNLGLMYLNGVGLPQDYVQGYAWVLRAAAAGAPGAAAARDRLFSSLTPDQVNRAQEIAASPE